MVLFKTLQYFFSVATDAAPNIAKLWEVEEQGANFTSYREKK